MKKRNYLYLLVAIFAVFLFFSISSVAVAEDKFELTFSNTDAPDSPVSMGPAKMAELVKERSNGRLTIKLMPNSALGNEQQQNRAVKAGTQDITGGTAGGLAMFWPPLSILDAGYLFKSYEHQRKVVTGPIGKELKDQFLKETGIRILGFYYQTARNLTTTDKLVKFPEDLEGVKIRAPDVKMYVEVVRGMGATPVPIPFDELYMALKLGTADGQENPLSTIYENKFYEVQKYIMLTEHMMSVGVLAMNDKKFQQLGPQLQQILQTAADEVMPYIAQLHNQIYDQRLAGCIRNGMTVVVPDREAFRKRVQKHIVPMFEEEWGKGLYEKIAAVE